MFPTTRLMACATFFKRFMELKIKLIRRVARLVFQPMTVAMLVLLISPDHEAWERFIALLLAWSRVFGLWSLVKVCLLARINDVIFLCKYTLYSHITSLYWEFKLVHACGGGNAVT